MKAFATKSTRARQDTGKARAATPVAGGLAMAAPRQLAAAFVDNRAAAIAQRKLADAIDRSPRLNDPRASGQHADSSPFMVAQREQLDGVFDTTAQLEGGLEEEEPLQGKFAPVQLQGPEEEMLQGKLAPLQRQGTEEEELQMKKGSSPAPAVQLRADSAPPSNDTGLPDDLKSGIESLSGMSMDSVKVHYNSARPAQLNALAHAQGSDIRVVPGQEQHLPHEAWHVVQQAQGRVQPTMQMKEGIPVNDDVSLEHEADVMGAKAKSVGTKPR